MHVYASTARATPKPLFHMPLIMRVQPFCVHHGGLREPTTSPKNRYMMASGAYTIVDTHSEM